MPTIILQNTGEPDFASHVASNRVKTQDTEKTFPLSLVELLLQYFN